MEDMFLAGTDDADADMNDLIFSTLEPLEESKDDMYFFGCKDIFESKFIFY